MTNNPRLKKDFYEQDTIDLAIGLLNKRLVHRLNSGVEVMGLIVETEAYLGVHDPAAHSFTGRRTPRTEVMFSAAGTSYVYFIYGMYFCFNVVTAEQGVPEAVLVRALDLRPLDVNLANGPGKLCRALNITRAQNGLDLCTSNELWIEDPGLNWELGWVEGPRVGIGDRHDAVHWPLRYGLKNHPCLSPARFPNYLD